MSAATDLKKKIHSHKNAHFAILAVKNDEYEALKSVFGVPYKVDNFLHDTEAHISLNTCYIKDHPSVELVCIETQGLQGAASKIGKYLGKYTPQYAVLYGTCGSDILPIGQIIICFEAYCYESGKYNNDGVFERDSHKFHTEDRTQLAGLGTRDDCVYGNIISGSAVRSDGVKIIQQERANVDREIKALEMEASAFFEVCRYYKETSSLGCIKVVMDNLKNKSDAVPGNQTKMQLMKKCCKFLLEAVVPKMTEWDPKESASLAAVEDIVHGYTQNYLNVVVDHMNGRDGPKKLILYQFPYDDRSCIITSRIANTCRSFGLTTKFLTDIKRDVLIPIDSQDGEEKAYYEIPRFMVKKDEDQVVPSQYASYWLALKNYIQTQSQMRRVVEVRPITLEEGTKEYEDRKNRETQD